MKYFIAPRSGEKSYKNFQSTIKHGVPFENIEPYLTEDGKRKLLSEDVIYSWGNRPGTRSQWESMEDGDTVIFYAKGELVMSGEVYYKQQSPELALAMWPPDEHGNPWEYTFFLKKLKYFKMPMRAFNWAAGFSSKFIVQGFIPLKPERVEAIVKEYGSVENLLNTFSFTSEASAEIPSKNDKLFVNVASDVEPEVRAESRLKPKANILVSEPGIKTPKKVNYQTRNKTNAITGSKGEAVVVKFEKNRLIEAGRKDLAARVKRISTDDDTVGYDVASFDTDGSARYIEVKTSTGSGSGVRFFMSANEMRTSKKLDNYFVYYVDAINTNKPRIIEIECPLDNKLAISTDTYLLEGEYI